MAVIRNKGNYISNDRFGINIEVNAGYTLQFCIIWEVKAELAGIRVNYFIVSDCELCDNFAWKSIVVERYAVEHSEQLVVVFLVCTESFLK